MGRNRLVALIVAGLLAAAIGYAVAFLRPAPITALVASSVGGSFELTAHNGRRFSNKDLAGKPFAIFFGFTQCPDVCPTTLLDISNHLTALGEKAGHINVVFVSVDPERDSAQHMRAYLASFDRRIVGLTGTAEEVARIVRNYRVFVQKVPTSSGYTINHTASVYLMDTKGAFVGTLSFQEPPETQLKKLRRLAGS